MEKRYYLDTSVWMDYYEDRKDPSKDIGENAYKMLCRLLKSKSKIVVSNFIQRELESFYTFDEIRGMTSFFEKIMIRVEITQKEMDEAGRVFKERGVPAGDALHAIIARDNQAILVTRDKHFSKLKDICNVTKPEDLI